MLLTIYIYTRLGTYNPIPQADALEFQKYIMSIGPSSNLSVTPPALNQKHIQLNYERIKYYISNGASVTSKVSWILAKAGMIFQLVLE